MRKLSILLLLALLVACQPGAAPLSDQDRDAIRGLGDSYAEAVVAADADAVAALYADDAIEMPPNEPAVTGREAIRERYAAGFEYEASSVEFTITSENIDGVDGLAYDRGTWAWTGIPPGMAEPVTETGKHLVIARRQADGSWLWTDVIWNSDAPLPEAQTAEPEVE